MLDDQTAILFNQALEAEKQGAWHQARSLYLRLLEQPGNHASVHFNLSHLYQSQGRHAEALYHFNLVETYAPQLDNLGTAKAASLQAMGDQAGMIRVYRQSLALHPADWAVMGNLGLLLRLNPDEALRLFQKSYEIKPDHPISSHNIGFGLQENARFAESVPYFRQAIALAPQQVQSHYGLALSLLNLGEYEEGLERHESRFQAMLVTPRPFFATHKMWEGEALADKTLFLHAEQGLGDSLQMIRYLSVLRGKVGKVILEIQAELAPLIPHVKNSDLIDQIIIRDQDPIPPFDVYLPLFGFPRVCQTRFDSIPNHIPYIKAETSQLALWQDRLKILGKGLKVGLAWAGNPDNFRVYEKKTILLKQFSPLSDLYDIHFISLQKGKESQQEPPEGLFLQDFTAELDDLRDTAALIECLDLVISVDTAVVHLAAAMGKPTWLLSRYAADWRWPTGFERSPWYPDVKIYWQGQDRNWDPVLRQVADDLRNFHS